MRQLKIQSLITRRDSLALEKYLQDINKLDLLTPEQEVELAHRIQQGDHAALEQMTNANLRFVVSVAKQYQSQGLTLNDLINEGNLGLMKAAKRFDPSRGFKFISYAVWWIRQSIMQALVEQARMVRLPLNKVDAYQKLYKALGKFLQENERQPSARELSEITGLKVNDVEELLNLGGRHISMDAPTSGDDDNEMTMLDSLQSNEGNPDDSLLSESLRNEIIIVLSVLSPREAGIVRDFYGLGDSTSPLSLEEIADKFGLTRERVRQIKERALRRLRKASQSQELKGYMG